MPPDNRVTITAGTGRLKTITAPKEELEKWDEWADELDMSRSQFIRVAVNAGVAKVDPPSFGSAYDDDGQSFRTEIKDAIQSGATTPDAVVEAVTDAVATDIREELQAMIETGNVTMSAYDGLTLQGDHA